jgi:hypothetical protein
MITPLFVSEGRLSLSQAALSLAIQLSVPPSELLTLKVWAAGLAHPVLQQKKNLPESLRWPLAGPVGATVAAKLRSVYSDVATARFIIGKIIGRHEVILRRCRRPDIETRHFSQGGKRRCLPDVSVQGS